MANRIICPFSSFVRGVPHALRRLSEMEPQIVQAIIPSRSQRSTRVAPRFDMRVVGQNHLGYKLLAKRKDTLQEIFAVTDVSQQVLQYSLDEVIGKNHVARLQGRRLPSGLSDEQFKAEMAKRRAVLNAKKKATKA